MYYLLFIYFRKFCPQKLQTFHLKNLKTKIVWSRIMKLHEVLKPQIQFKLQLTNALKIGQTSNKVSRYDESLDKAVDTLKFVCEQKSKTNEFIIFGQHVAAQLEKLPLEKSIILQEQIQSLLTKARLDEISRPASSTVLLTNVMTKHDETNNDERVIEVDEFKEDEEGEPQTFYDNSLSESDNITVFYNNFM